MSASPPKRIVIVGGGASGALMAAHLLRGDPTSLRVTIVEARAELGRGLAYATGNPSHLLNVRAANMSAFADDPDHFVRWLSRQADGIARLAAIPGSALCRAVSMGDISKASFSSMCPGRKRLAR